MRPQPPSQPRRRPVYLDLFQIRFPLMAITSIAHRISGVLMILAIGPAVYALSLSLSGPAGFQRVQAALDSGPAWLVLVVIGWGFAHHFFAGLRYLLMDIGRGMERETARRSALATLVLGVAGAIAIGWWLA